MHTVEINAKTTICAVIGNPIEHSLSPAIHNAAFSALGLNWAYVACKVEQIEKAIDGIRALNIRGVSVTIPHKVKALPLLDAVDETARMIGSINTIVNTAGHLAGCNSDGDGALKALLDAGCNPEGKTVIILGSGGAARAIAFTLALKAPPRQLTILGVIEQEFLELSADIARKTPTNPAATMLTHGNLAQALRAGDVLVNCTPLGMYPKTDGTPVPSDLLHKNLVVFDIVYNPVKTVLLNNADRTGCVTISGIEMFLNQAALQFSLWTGKPAPVDVMRAVLKKHFR